MGLLRYCHARRLALVVAAAPRGIVLPRGAPVPKKFHASNQFYVPSFSYALTFRAPQVLLIEKLADWFFCLANE
jgi:hypothetical protein